MSFLEYLEQSKIQRLLDFYNLEEISWSLQNLLFTKEQIPFKVTEQGNLTDLFKHQFNFSLKMIHLERGTFRLMRQFPELNKSANQFLYFEDDVFQFFSLTNKVIPKYVLTGRQVLINTQLKPQSLSEMFLIDYYYLQIIPGQQRQEFNRYLKELNPYEWQEKSHLSYVMRELMRINNNPSKIQKILNQRSIYLNITLPDISQNKQLMAIQDISRGNEIMKIYNLPNIPLTQNKSTLYIKELVKYFCTNSTHLEFLKNIERIKSYEYHLERFIKRLIYLYHKSQRAKL